MADLTSAGRPSAERNETLYRRRLELQIMRHRASILEAEIEIEQKRDDISRLQERIEITKKQVSETEAELTTRQGQGGNSNG